MQQLRRLLKELKATYILSSITECLKPENFDKVVQTTKTVCVVQSKVVSRNEFQTPSLALKIGYFLKKCVSCERGKCP